MPSGRPAATEPNPRPERLRSRFVLPPARPRHDASKCRGQDSNLRTTEDRGLNPAPLTKLGDPCAHQRARPTVMSRPAHRRPAQPSRRAMLDATTAAVEGPRFLEPRRGAGVALAVALALSADPVTTLAARVQDEIELAARPTRRESALRRHAVEAGLTHAPTGFDRRHPAPDLAHLDEVLLRDVLVPPQGPRCEPGRTIGVQIGLARLAPSHGAAKLARDHDAARGAAAGARGRFHDGLLDHRAHDDGVTDALNSTGPTLAATIRTTGPRDRGRAPRARDPIRLQCLPTAATVRHGRDTAPCATSNSTSVVLLSKG